MSALAGGPPGTVPGMDVADEAANPDGTGGVEMNARMEENTEAKEEKNPAAANGADDAGEGAGDRRSNDAPDSR